MQNLGSTPSAHGSEYSRKKPEEQNASVSEQLAASIGSRASVNAQGGLDVLATVGGVRGLIEAILPSAVFLGIFIFTNELVLAGAVSLGVSVVFTTLRLFQKQPTLQALTGLIGVGLCVAVALFTNEARQYYLIGFYTNIAYLIGLSISMLVRWPLMGLVFGFIRGENVSWRDNRQRLIKYQIATAFLVAMFASRLIVQLPLYWADEVGMLGTARLVMGVPLYAMALWLAWVVSRPTKNIEARNSGSLNEAKTESSPNN